jgi:hypothetical protein
MAKTDNRIQHYWHIISHLQNLISLSDNKVNILIALIGGFSAIFWSSFQQLPQEATYIKYIYLLTFIISIICSLLSLLPRGVQKIKLNKWVNSIDSDHLEDYANSLKFSIDKINTILFIKVKLYRVSLFLMILQILLVAIAILLDAA